MAWLSDHEWEAWLIVAVGMGLLEVVSLDLVFIMLAGGAFVGALVAAFGLAFALQLVGACITAVALLALIRPNIVHKLHAGPSLRLGVDALIGKRATVLHEMSHAAPGRVKIDGEEWTAEPYDEDDRIEAGASVDVVQIRGATAYVLRVPGLEQ